jgi:hypothetical protein
MNIATWRDIELQHLVEVRFGVVLDPGTSDHAAGIVDQHIDAAERRQRFGDDTYDVGAAGDVAVHQ